MPVPISFDYSRLTNEEIQHRLKAVNFPNAGPVNDTTRKVYLKKLEEFEKAAGITQEASGSDSASERNGGEATSSRGTGGTPKPKSQTRKSVGVTPNPKPAASKSPARRRTIAPSVPEPQSASRLRTREETDSSAYTPPVLPRRSAIVPRSTLSDRHAASLRGESAADLSDTEVTVSSEITGFRRRAPHSIYSTAFSYEPVQTRRLGSLGSYGLSTPDHRPGWFSKAYAYVNKAGRKGAVYLKRNLNYVMFWVVTVSIVGMFIYATFRRPGSVDNYPACPHDSVRQDCIPAGDLKEARENFLKVKPILETRAFLHDWPDCSGDLEEVAIARTSRGMSFDEILDRLPENEIEGANFGERFAKMRHISILAAANPHWDVDVVGTNRLELKRNFLPLFCLFKVFAEVVFWRLTLLASVFAIGYLAYYAFRYYSREKERKEKQVFSLVEKAIMVLSAHRTDNPDNPTMAIHLVRDELIKASMRNDPETMALWNKAVQFLETKETRVRSEMGRVDGYDVKVWRFVGATSPAKANASGLIADGNDTTGLGDADMSQDEDFEMTDGARSPAGGRRVRDDSVSGQQQLLRSQGKRIWQGPAFDNNKPKTSPTPCLKIRNMFDPETETGDHWPAEIQDSILEKCEGIPITHIAVDRASREGVVYMKCIDERAAGLAYCALHGHWFNQSLVTVKYLPTDRYYQRFPQARNRTDPILRF